MDGSVDEQRPINPKFNEMTDMTNVQLVKGMNFPNSKIFRKVLREYVIQHYIDIKWKLNEKKKISVQCKNNSRWRCYTSMVTEECTFEIKTLNLECTCPLTFQNGQVTSAYVANRYLEDFSKNHNWEVSGVKHYVMQQIFIDLTLSQVCRSRKATRGLIIGNEEAQYGLLRDYAEMIRRTNIGSKVILQMEMENENAEPKFKRMYIRYNAQKVGFLGGCRPFVKLDGCHLKGRFGRQLLSATAKDGNDNIFLVAMAVVKQENKDNWI